MTTKPIMFRTIPGNPFHVMPIFVLYPLQNGFLEFSNVTTDRHLEIYKNEKFIPKKTLYTNRHHSKTFKMANFHKFWFVIDRYIDWLIYWHQSTVLSKHFRFGMYAKVVDQSRII